MTYRIHYTLSDGTEDWIDISGDDLDEMRERAREHVESRGGTNPWSEEL